MSAAAYRTFIRHVLHVARVEGDEQAIREIRDEMKVSARDNWNHNAVRELMGEASRLFPEMSTTIAFAFFIAWRKTGGTYGPNGYSDLGFQELFARRLNCRSIYQFCSDHEDCCDDIAMSMTCAED